MVAVDVGCDDGSCAGLNLPEGRLTSARMRSPEVRMRQATAIDLRAPFPDAEIDSCAPVPETEYERYASCTRPKIEATRVSTPSLPRRLAPTAVESDRAAKPWAVPPSDRDARTPGLRDSNYQCELAWTDKYSRLFPIRPGATDIDRFVGDVARRDRYHAEDDPPIVLTRILRHPGDVAARNVEGGRRCRAMSRQSLRSAQER